jgi:hypothetical protein
MEKECNIEFSRAVSSGRRESNRKRSAFFEAGVDANSEPVD